MVFWKNVINYRVWLLSNAKIAFTYLKTPSLVHPSGCDLSTAHCCALNHSLFTSPVLGMRQQQQKSQFKVHRERFAVLRHFPLSFSGHNLLSLCNTKRSVCISFSVIICYVPHRVLGCSKHKKDGIVTMGSSPSVRKALPTPLTDLR